MSVPSPPVQVDLRNSHLIQLLAPPLLQRTQCSHVLHVSPAGPLPGGAAYPRFTVGFLRASLTCNVIGSPKMLTASTCFIFP
jgi:hypothetical protein